MNRILCIGECMVELAPIDGPLYRRGFAGDTFNSAWYLRRALPVHWSVDYATCVGTDGVSDELLAFIAAAGIGTDGIRRIADRTVGLYMIGLRDGERSFTYWRSAAAARLLAADAGWLADRLAGAGAALFSGITLAILPPDDRPALLAALAAARAAGTVIVFDPNIRRHLWPDADTARDAIAAAAATADIVLPSFEDESALFGDADPDATIARYRATGADVVVVKDGAQPVVGWSAGAGRVVQRPPRIRPVDTTAAGDSFNAGFLAAQLQAAPFAEALAAGARLAAHVCSARGALVP